MPTVPESYKSRKPKLAPTPPDGVPRLISGRDLKANRPILRPVVVEGIARRGETVNVVAPSKVGKSWLMYLLATSITHGEKWLGFLFTQPGRVLFIDNELHEETLSHRIQQVQLKSGLSTDEIDFLPLRGTGMHYEKLHETIKYYFELQQYDAVIVDSHYRMMAPATEENSNGQLRDVYNLIDELAGMTTAAWFLVHHQTKGDQSGKEITDVGAGGGAQARAADTHLIFRRHKERGAFVMDAAVRSFPQFAPVVVQFQPPLWVLAKGLNPQDLKVVKPVKERRKDTQEAITNKILLGLHEVGEPISSNQLRLKLSINKDRCRTILDQLDKQGLIKSKPAKVGGNDTVVYFSK